MTRVLATLRQRLARLPVPRVHGLTPEVRARLDGYRGAY